MLQCGAISGNIERPPVQKQVAAGPITPVHDLNVPYEGPVEEYETPTAEMLFPPVRSFFFFGPPAKESLWLNSSMGLLNSLIWLQTPLQTPIPTPLPGTGDQGMYNIPTGPSDYAPSPISDVRNGIDVKTGRPNPCMV